MKKKLPILLLGYRRPELTRKVLSAIAQYAPAKLYVSCDGPKPGIASDEVNVNAVRNLMDNPTWDCEIYRLHRQENLGIRIAITHALDWFFEKEPEGIVLEDDCVPTEDFFRFAEHCIEKYRHDKKIWGLTGANTAGIRVNDEASYGFVQNPLIWGWASWANRWQERDYYLETFNPGLDLFRKNNWPSRFHKYVFHRHLSSMIFRGTPNTWDYPWAWTVMSRGGLWIVPNENQITNVGFGPDGTHIFDDRFKTPPPKPLGELVDPVEVVSSMHKEKEILRYIHGLRSPAVFSFVRHWGRRLLSPGILARRLPVPPLPK